ncbi:MAG: D-alanine--D-alanine ligase A, partial [Anaerolineales bacterium]|nr:D-alanine--D-alanine ligase A [Anaerolineales bacterium]
MSEEKRLRVAVMFGGRSGEHEVSLQSARSVLAVLDPARYEALQIGITHDGSWLVGGQVLQAMLDSATEGWASGAILPVPSINGLFKILPAEQGQRLELLSQIDVVFPVLHGT